MSWRNALVTAFATAALAQTPKTILAIGAHAGDMEITAGAALARHVRLGDRVVLLHLTLGEGGNPKLSPEAYGRQKRQEALAAARVLGVEARFGPYKDGELPDDDATRRWVADVIRQVAPTHIITHWRRSIHKDHAAAHAVVTDAVLLASLEGVVTQHPPHRGVRGIYFAENWEDSEEFRPFLYVDVSEDLTKWRDCVRSYEFIRGGVSSFPYLDYYESLARVRGAEAGKRYAISFEVPTLARKRVVEALP